MDACALRDVYVLNLWGCSPQTLGYIFSDITQSVYADVTHIS